MFDLNKLQTLETANRKNTKRKYDLHHNRENHSFRLAPDLMESFGINAGKGITAALSTEDKKAYIMVIPEENATVLKGKEGADKKGNTFKYTTLSNGLDMCGVLNPNLKLEKVHEDENGAYYEILSWVEKEEEVSEEKAEKASEETDEVVEETHEVVEEVTNTAVEVSENEEEENLL